MYKPTGYVQVCELYLERLKTKKLIALFSNFLEAKNDIIFEFSLEFDNDNFEAIKEVINHFELIADTEEYFNEL